MKTKRLLIALAFLGLAIAGQAKEKANPETANATMSVGQTLAGHVIQMVDGAAQDAKIKSDAEYYVLYHSASW